MISTDLIIGITVLVILLLVAFLPKERAERVHRLVKMMMSLLPISAVIKALREPLK
jgi:hypothetical protein